MKVAVHQGSVLRSLLFVTVMEDIGGTNARGQIGVAVGAVVRGCFGFDG